MMGVEVLLHLKASGRTTDSELTDDNSKIQKVEFPKVKNLDVFKTF